MKHFKTESEAREYLDNKAFDKTIETNSIYDYFIDLGADKKGNDIMLLIECDDEIAHRNIIETVSY